MTRQKTNESSYNWKDQEYQREIEDSELKGEAFSDGYQTGYAYGFADGIKHQVPVAVPRPGVAVKRMRTKSKGFALTEVLLAIAVIIIIGICAYPVYQKSRRDAEVIRIVSATVDFSSTVDKFRTMIAENLPNPTANPTQAFNFDLLGFLNVGGLMDTDEFTNNSNGLGTSAIVGQGTPVGSYYLRGTNWQFSADANTSGYTIDLIELNGKDVDECVALAKELSPEFDQFFEINAQPVTAKGSWATVYGNMKANVLSITNACANAGPNGGYTEIYGYKTF